MVYRQIGTEHYLIAKADAIVIAIYVKVFGPDTYQKCQDYVTAHTATSTVNLVPGSLNAWIDKRPGPGPGPKLIVTVEAMIEEGRIGRGAAAGVQPLRQAAQDRCRGA